MEEILFYKEGKIEYPSFFSEMMLCRWMNDISLHYQRKLGSLNFIFCDDEYILDVNRRYLKHDYYTDVITFDYSGGDVLSGDIFISLDTVKSNSLKFQVSFENEFYRVVCHSLLHLIGFKDKSEDESVLMRMNEDVCLNLIKTI